MNCYVSVIITCYNHEKYIEQCLRSVFTQSHKNIELLVINDGSTDRSDDIIKKVLNDSPFKNTKYIFQENKGACISRNIGLDWISGDFVLMVDSDNYLPNNYLEASLNELESSQKDIAYCSLRDAETNEIINEAPDFSLQRLITANFIDTCSMIRVSAVGQHRFDEKLNRLFMQDYDFFLSLIHSGAKAIKVPGLYLNYRILENSIGNRGNDRNKRLKWLEVYGYINSKYPEYANNITNLLKMWYFDLNNELIETKYLMLENDAQSEDVDSEVFSTIKALYRYNNSLQQEKITIYFSYADSEYIEEYKIQFEMKEEDSIEFEIPTDVCEIRIDLSEMPIYFDFVELFDDLGRLVKFKHTNGVQLDNHFYFATIDPQIYYPVKEQQAKNVKLNYKKTPLYHFFEDDSPLISMAALISCQKSDLNELTKNQAQLMLDYSELNNQYQKVLNSIVWRTRVKIIKFIKFCLRKK